MKCDVCGKNIENSEELQKHKEEMHPPADDGQSTEDLETPDLLGDTPEQSAEAEIPKPTY